MSDEMGSATSETDESEGGEDIFSQVLRGGGIAFVANLVSKAIGFVFNIVVAQFLGAGGYGLFVLGLTITQLAQPVALLGLPDGIVRYVSKYRSEGAAAKVRGTVFTSLLISGSLGVLFGIGAILLSRPLSARVFNDPELTEVLPIFGVAIPFFVLLQASTSVAVGFKRVEFQQAIQNIAFPLLKLGFVGGALYLGYQLVGAVSGLVLAVAVSSLAGLAVIPRVFSEIDVRGPIQTEHKTLLRYSMPVFLSGFSYLALNQFDRLILGAFRSAASVGIYNASSVLSQQGIIFFVALVTIFNPIASDLYSSGSIDRLEVVYQTVSRWLLVCTFPIVVIGALFSTELLLLFRAEFVEGVPVLVILFVVQLLYVAVGPAGELLQMSGFQDIVLIDTATMLVVNIVLNLLLIPRYGAIGAAVATGTSIAGVQLAELYQTKKYVGIQPLERRYFYVAAIGGLFAVATYGVSLLSLALVPRIASAVVVTAGYAVLIWIFTITEEDREMLRTLIS
jgi:O-antigen/teichoic acid export membrane protein